MKVPSNPTRPKGLKSQNDILQPIIKLIKTATSTLTSSKIYFWTVSQPLYVCVKCEGIKWKKIFVFRQIELPNVNEKRRVHTGPLKLAWILVFYILASTSKIPSEIMSSIEGLVKGCDFWIKPIFRYGRFTALKWRTRMQLRYLYQNVPVFCLIQYHIWQNHFFGFKNNWNE